MYEGSGENKEVISTVTYCIGIITSSYDQGREVTADLSCLEEVGPEAGDRSGTRCSHTSQTELAPPVARLRTGCRPTP